MTDDELRATLVIALEALITEAEAKGPGRVLTTAERSAVLWVTDREGGPEAARLEFPLVPEAVRTQLH